MPSDSPLSQRPAQFALRHLFVLLLVVSIVLALVTQLWHIGLVAAIYVTGVAAGVWWRNWRLAAAAATALAVFAVTYLACWLQLGFGGMMEHYLYVRTHHTLRTTEMILQQYHLERGEFPESLAAAAPVAVGEEYPADDAWGTPLQYRRTADGFELSSLGRDGKAGGAGLDADIFLPTGERRFELNRLPWHQFLFETKSSRIVFFIATVASAISAAIWFSAQRRDQPEMRQMIFSTAVTAVLAVIVAVFLAFFHVAASQSGH